MLEEAIKMLPTPVAADGREKGGGGRWSPTSAPLEQTLKDELKLLPTPVTADSRNTRNATANNGKGSTGNSGTTLSDVAWLWSGELTSPPSEDGKPSTDLRLNPSFVEWMMGTPRCNACGRGWTDPDCPHSATEFKSRSDSSPAPTSSSSNGGV